LRQQLFSVLPYFIKGHTRNLHLTAFLMFLKTNKDVFVLGINFLLNKCPVFFVMLKQYPVINYPVFFKPRYAKLISAIIKFTFSAPGLLSPFNYSSIVKTIFFNKPPSGLKYKQTWQSASFMHTVKK
jgi:hypothetical protein